MIDIEFICNDEKIIKYWSPTPCAKSRPKWFDSMPKIEKRYPHTFPDNPDLVDYLDSGYTIYNCYDLKFYHKQENFSKSLMIETAKFWTNPIIGKANKANEGETAVLTEEFCPAVNEKKSKKDYFYFESDWGIRTPKGISCFIMQPFYDFEKKFTILPRVVDTDVYHGPLPVIGYLNTPETVFLNAGDPLLQVIPFPRQEYKMKITKDCPSREANYWFSNFYEKMFHIKKRYD